MKGPKGPIVMIVVHSKNPSKVELRNSQYDDPPKRQPVTFRVRPRNSDDDVAKALAVLITGTDREKSSSFYHFRGLIAANPPRWFARPAKPKSGQEVVGYYSVAEATGWIRFVES